MSDSNQKSNLEDILDLPRMKENLQNERNIIETEETEEFPPARKSFSQNHLARLGIAFAIVTVCVIPLYQFYNASTALTNALTKEKEDSVIDAEMIAESEIPDEENLRAIISIGEQGAQIKALQNQKPEPQPKIELVASEKPVIKPVTQPPKPKPQPIVRRNVSTPKIAVTKPKLPQVEKWDDMGTWSSIAAVGTYGTGALEESHEPATNPIVQSWNQIEAQIPPKLPPILAVNFNNQSEITEAEAAFLEALQQADEPLITETKDGATIAIAQQVKAKLVSGINWAGGQKQRTFIQLEEPLMNTDGTEAIAAETLIVYEIEKIESGVVDGKAVSLILKQQEIPLPQGAISVLNKKKQMLTAKLKEISNGDNQDLMSFALGATKQTQELLNQPNSATSIITSLGQSSSTNYEDKDYVGSAVTGGLAEVLENRTNQLNRQRDTAVVSSYWEVKSGTTLTIQTNLNFQI